MPVEGVERLEFAAVGEEIQTAIGEHTVDIKNRQLDALGALLQISVHYSTPARNRSCMFRAPMGMPWASMTTKPLILWSSMIFNASAASMSARAVLPGLVITSSMPALRTSMPLS